MPVSRRVSMSRPGSSWLATSLIAFVGLFAIAACSPSATTTPSAAGAATGTPPAATAAATAASSAGAASCGADTASLVQQHFASRTDIVSVGGCQELKIVTTLGDGDGATAITICDAASQIAYGPDFSSITVTGASTKVLATGVFQTDCVGKP